MKSAFIIVAGGRGVRAGGDRPKQLQTLGGRPVFSWSVEVAVKSARFDDIVLVVPAGTEAKYRPYLPEHVLCVDGGSTRSESVQSALSALKFRDDDLVFVHDAARPGLEVAVVDRLFRALETADAVAPALPVADALRHLRNGNSTPVERRDLYRIQTPQAMRFGAISAALSGGKADYVDDLSAVEAHGAKTVLVEGAEKLSKVTYPEDLQRLEALLTPKPHNSVKIGAGFDVHAFGPGDHVTLCGVALPHDRGLAGHSDADVAWHALTDAILGAAALGDIGDHFPPSDPKWAGAASSIFLGHAVKLAAEAGFRISNLDLTLICEAPKIKPYREEMRRSTAELLFLNLSQVSIKATTTEGLGFTGRGEGIAAQATVLLTASDSTR